MDSSRTAKIAAAALLVSTIASGCAAPPRPMRYTTSAAGELVEESGPVGGTFLFLFVSPICLLFDAIDTPLQLFGLSDGTGGGGSNYNYSTSPSSTYTPSYSSASGNYGGGVHSSGHSYESSSSDAGATTAQEAQKSRARMSELRSRLNGL